jgi:hypothetical protein
MGALFAVQSTEDWMRKIGAETVKGLVDIVSTWICLSSGPFTAELFSKFCGDVEGRQGSRADRFEPGDRDKNQPGGVEASCPRVEHGLDSRWDYVALRKVAIAVVRDRIGLHPDYRMGRRGARYREPFEIRNNWWLNILAETHFRALYIAESGGLEPPPPGPGSLNFGTSWGLQIKPAVLPGEITALLPADPDADRLCGFLSNNKTGVYYFQVPFLAQQKDLPPASFDEIPARDYKPLRVWDDEDLKRLKIPHEAKELRDALDELKGKGGKP